MERRCTLLESRVLAAGQDLSGRFGYEARRCDRVVAAGMAALAAYR